MPVDLLLNCDNERPRADDDWVEKHQRRLRDAHISFYLYRTKMNREDSAGVVPSGTCGIHAENTDTHTL